MKWNADLSLCPRWRMGILSQGTPSHLATMVKTSWSLGKPSTLLCKQEGWPKTICYSLALPDRVRETIFCHDQFWVSMSKIVPIQVSNNCSKAEVDVPLVSACLWPKKMEAGRTGQDGGGREWSHGRYLTWLNYTSASKMSCHFIQHYIMLNWGVQIKYLQIKSVERFIGEIKWLSNERFCRCWALTRRQEQGEVLEGPGASCCFIIMKPRFENIA